jgi:hypothetical protein
VRRTGQGLAIGRLGTPLVEINNIRFENNLLENVGHSAVDPDGFDDPGGAHIDSALMNRVSIRRNTWIYGKNSGAGGMAFRNSGPQRDLAFEDNISTGRLYGNGPAFGEGCQLFLQNTAGTVYVRNIGLIRDNDNWSLFYGSCNAVRRVATLADVRFVNANGGENGDYRLCTGSGVPDAACTGASPWSAAGSDGGPIGADAQVVAWATAGVEAGAADLGWWQFRIRRADKHEVRYTAYDVAPCSGMIIDTEKSVVHSWNDEGGPGRDRATALPTLPVGAYKVRVTCAGGRWREDHIRVY